MSTWTTASGEVINLKDMDILHLQNARAFCLRRWQAWQDNASTAAGYPGQGEMACYYADQAMVDALEQAARWGQKLGMLDNELKRRKKST